MIQGKTFFLLNKIQKHVVSVFCLTMHHGRRKDFFQGWPLGYFSKIFQGGGKSGES